MQTNNVFPNPLSPEDEQYYIQRLKIGDKEAKNILIEHNLRLVAHICKKYTLTNVDQDDLISIGTIGLIKGINSFNSDKNIKLATYVSRCIENEILMFLRSTKKLKSEVFLEDTIGSDKDNNTLALIDVLIQNDNTISVEDSLDLKLKIKTVLYQMNKVLKERERLIIELRFGLNGKKPKTQKDIASLLNISRSYVSRIETKAIKKLHKVMQE